MCGSQNEAGPMPLQCGQDAEFSVAYVSDGSDLRDVCVEFVVSTMNGECMLLLNNNMIARLFRRCRRVAGFGVRFDAFR